MKTISNLYETCVSVFTDGQSRNHFIQFCFQEKQKMSAHSMIQWCLWFLHQEFLYKTFPECLHQAYDLFFETYAPEESIDPRSQFIYTPRTSSIPSRYSLYWGCDTHFYGWNLIGKVVEQKLKRESTPDIHMDVLFLLYELCSNIQYILDHSHREIIKLSKLSISELIHYFHLIPTHKHSSGYSWEHQWVWKQYQAKELLYQTEMEIELNYPNSLVYLLFQKWFIRQISQCIYKDQPSDLATYVYLWNLHDLIFPKGSSESSSDSDRIPFFFIPYVGNQKKGSDPSVFYFQEDTDVWSPDYKHQLVYQNQSFSSIYHAFTFFLSRTYRLNLSFKSIQDFEQGLFEHFYHRLGQQCSVCLYVEENPFYRWIHQMMDYYKASSKKERIITIWFELSKQMDVYDSLHEDGPLSKEHYLLLLKILYPHVYSRIKSFQLTTEFPFFDRAVLTQCSRWTVILFPFLIRFLLCYLTDDHLLSFSECIMRNPYEWFHRMYALLKQDQKKTIRFMCLCLSRHSPYQKPLSSYLSPTVLDSFHTSSWLNREILESCYL